MKKLQNALYDKLPLDWQEKLRFFILSKDFLSILEWLQQEVEDDRRFCPPIKDLFRPFELTPLNRVKVVFLVPESYNDPSLANGLAISCNKSIRPAIEYFRFIQEFQTEFPKLIPSEEMLNGDLSAWALQGVLLLNVTPTAQVQRLGKHVDIWRGFFNYVLNILNRQGPLIFVAFGDIGGIDKLDPKHTVIQLKELPKDRDTKWLADGIFSRINNQLVKNKKEAIIW